MRKIGEESLLTTCRGHGPEGKWAEKKEDTTGVEDMSENGEGGG